LVPSSLRRLLVLEAIIVIAKRRRELSSTILFRASAELQGLLHTRYRLGTGATLGLFPYSATIVRRVEPTSTSARTPPTGFLNLPAGTTPATTRGFVPPHRHFEGSAFRGMTPDRSGFVSDPGLLRRYLPFMGFFHHLPAVPTARPARCYPFPIWFMTAPACLETGGSHLGLRPTLEFCSRSGALRSTPGFTQLLRSHLSWLSLLQGFFP
jgi:hypothetical protein